MDRGAVPSSAATRVDESEDDGCRYITQRDGQVRTLLHSRVRTTITNEARRVLALRWHVRSSLAKGEWNQADS